MALDQAKKAEIIAKLVGQRRRLMRYLKNTDLARWNTIKTDLGIRN